MELNDLTDSLIRTIQNISDTKKNKIELIVINI